MAESSKVSVDQFLACLRQQGPVSAQLKAASEFDVAALSDDEQRSVAKALRDFAGTKNGPMLIMGLPGQFQALLNFSAITMPGLDRLAYLRASPRQVVNRLIEVKDEKLLSEYPFDKVTKADWAYYLTKTTEMIEPCSRFFKKSESAGGFSDRELCDILEQNIEMERRSERLKR